MSNSSCGDVLQWRSLDVPKIRQIERRLLHSKALDALCAEKASKIAKTIKNELFLMIFKMIFREVNCCDAFFLLIFKSVIPTQRGDRIFKMIFPEVNCCDAGFSKYLRKHILLSSRTHGPRIAAPPRPCWRDVVGKV